MKLAIIALLTLTGVCFYAASALQSFTLAFAGVAAAMVAMPLFGRLNGD